MQAGKIEDSQTLEIAKKWIDSLHGNNAFFLGMNLQNTHFSYVLSPGAEQPYQPSELGFRAVYYRWPESERDRVRNRYLNSVLDVDQLLEGFADFLKARGLWDETLFVVLGDNGEAFYEHGFGNHSGPMYEEVVRTLAAIKLPASASVDRPDTEAPISHIDIAATIPDIAGLPRPWSFQGRSVLSHDCPGRPVLMYSNALVRQFGIVSWPWKYLVTEHPQEAEELYDLAADPDESVNLLEVDRNQSASLRASLMHWVGLQRKYYAENAYLDRLPPNYCSVPD
jgi:arylsulfatase A-like enzyme